MGWSWRLGRITGIDIYMHATFLLLLLWVGFVSYLPHQNIMEAVNGIVFILCLFAVVVLHELGHATVARQYGIKTRDITLLPIGGVARLERIPEEPVQELLVALAGPAVNVVLAGILFGVIYFAHIHLASPEQLASLGGNLISQLFVANIFLAVFNMIPAFPMDGGRVLRALLAMRLDYVRATRVAATVGQIIAMFFGLYGLMLGSHGWMLILIAVFVWIGASAEAGAVQFRAGLAGVPVSRAMIREFATLSPDDTLTAATRHVLDGFQHDFPVVDRGKVIGILSRDALMAALAESGPHGRVSDVMVADFKTADPREMLEPVVQRLKEGSCPVVPVIRDGELVGLLTLDNVVELVMIREAVKGREVPSLPAPAEGSS